MMEDIPRGPGLLRRGWSRLLDGDRPWGSIDIRPDRMGVTQYVLVVYPPGISEAERRSVRIWRGWPMWGALLWIASYVVLTQLIDPWAALTLPTPEYLGAGAAAFVRAGDARTRVRTMRATVMSGFPDPQSRAICHKLQALAVTLTEADQHRQLGLISPIEYEMTWWQVYDQIQPDQSRPRCGLT
jgi:Family of unknown function (DUF6611)